jgi:tetratricopeptide (TPR) repeat protein/predicted Ser/Thr protein kinase
VSTIYDPDRSGSSARQRQASRLEPNVPLAATDTNVDVARRLEPGTLVAGRYRIVALVGVGGMGIVYKAHDEELNLDVALKVLRSDRRTDPQLVERFRRELILARQVSHRNVVRIHDIGESDGLRFLTMGFVEGQSLLELLERGGPIPVDRTVEIVRQLAEALQHAHDAGVIHRDLKPGNILIAEDGTAYITDFGVARSAGRDGLTRMGAVVGTPDYLSPEQVAGNAVDHRADIYALGIVFYEMLSGRLPFSGDSQEEMLAQRLTGRITDINRTGVAIPRYVRRAIARCLERQPSRRYQHARELADDLDRRTARAYGLTAWRYLAVVVALAAAAGAWTLVGWNDGLPLVPFLARSTSGPAGAGPDISVRPALAVLPLTDETADSALAWTTTGVPEMLSANLSQSPELRVLDTQRVLRTLRDLGVSDARYDERVLGQLAHLLDVDTLVAGSVRRASTTMRVDLRLVNIGAADNARMRHLSAESAGEGGLFDVVDQLADRIRQELGSDRPASLDRHEGAPTSVAAAKAYVDGRSRLTLGDYVGAAPALERAVEADPRFAAALERLSETYQNLGYHEKALAAAEQAARAVETNGSRTGFRVRARLALLRGEPGEAEKQYAELARRYPNDTESLLDLASAQTGRGDIARAVETLTKVTAIDQNDPRAWFLLGKNTILMGDSRKAVNDYLIRALALQNQLRNEQGQGDALNAMGVGYHQLGDYPQALEKYSAAAAVRQQLKDDRGEATSLKNRARTLLAMSRPREAEPDLRAARKIYERIGDRNGLADVMNDFGVLQERRGAYSDALRDYQAALKIRRGLGDERLLAQSYDNVGYIYYVAGEYDNAAVYWKEALRLREKIGEKGGIILSMQNIGFLQTAQGRWTEALKSFLEALERSRAIDFRNAMAVSYGNVGILQHYQGRYEAALTSFEEALGILKQLADKRGLAEFTIKQAAVLLDIGQLKEAKTALDAAEPLVRESDNHEQRSDYFVLMAEWAWRRGDREAARRALDRAAEQAAASRSRSVILRARIARGAAAQALGNDDVAIATLAPALRDAESLGDVLLRLRATEALARGHLARRRSGEAETLARSAVSIAERCGWEAGLYRLHALLGATLEQQGRPSQAAAEYNESARRIQKLREGLPPSLRESFDALPAVRQAGAR